MAAGDGGPTEGPEELVPSDKYTGTVGSHSKGVGDVFKGGCAGGTYLWVGDVCDDPPHGPGPRGGSTQGI